MKDTTKKKIIKWFWVLFTTPILLVAALIFCVWMFADIPSFEELENPQSNLATQVIAEDGEILTTFHIENRSYVNYDELSPNLVHAAVATEDVLHLVRVVQVQYHVGALQQFVADTSWLQHLIHYTGRTPRCQVHRTNTEDDGLTHHSAALLTFTFLTDHQPAILDWNESYLFHVCILVKMLLLLIPQNCVQGLLPCELAALPASRAQFPRAPSHLPSSSLFGFDGSTV